MITIFKNIKTVSAGFIRPIDEILSRIKNGNSKDLIQKIREEQDKSARNILKQQLPSICFSGEFKQRNESSLLKHSGFICLDFDNLDDIRALRDTIEGDEFTFSCFLSPSGKGLKVIVKIPAVIQDHKLYFAALSAYYNSEYFDDKTSDITRVCYESYDPDIYINKGSTTWTKKSIPDLEDVGVRDAVIPQTESYIIIKNLRKWWDDKYGFRDGERNTNLIKLCYAFNDFGISQTEAKSACSEFICKDFTEGEVDTVIRSAYSKTQNFGTKQFENYQAKRDIEKDIINGKSIKRIRDKYQNIERLEDAVEDIKDSISEDEFWGITKAGKYYLIHHKFKNYLQSNHIFKYYPSENSFVFVKVNENKVSILTKDQIKDFVLNDLHTREGIGFQPYELMAGSTKYFKEDYLGFLDSIDLNLKKDTQTESYLYFQNVVLKITKESVEEIAYLDLDGYVWDKQVIDRNFVKMDSSNGMYRSFIWKVSGESSNRYESIKSAIGYLMHGHKTSANNKAVILNDEVISEHPNGGSGKGLFAQGLSKLKKLSILDGKQFSFDKSFVYQTVAPDTQVLVFDDVKKNFNFERLFSVITEGITIERKNMDALPIGIEDSPKVLITTNYTIGGIGGSFERRKFELEFSSYFGADHSPLDEFGCMLFEDWNAHEWECFDNFMIRCLQQYLTKGLLESNYHNLETRKFIKETAHEFYEWTKNGGIELGTQNYNALLFQAFIDEYEDFRNYKWFTRRKFIEWVNNFCKYSGLEYTRDRDAGGRYIIIHKDKTPF